MNFPSHTYCPTSLSAVTIGAVYFSFTGKELDAETGYSYFGARYYDPAVLAAWLSVDPMSDKYPNISPYAYCAWNRPSGGHEHLLNKFNLVNNPMKLVDPEGEEFEKIIDHENKTIKIRAQFCSYGTTKEQQEFIQKSANEWNACSFNVSLRSEDGSMSDYTVSFDINNGNGPTNFVSFLPDDYYNQNYYNNSGGISDGHGINIRNS